MKYNIHLFDDDFQNELDNYYSYHNDISIRYKHKLRINNFRRIFNEIKISQKANVLDVGCGKGAYSIILGAKGFKTIGIDIDSEGLKIARLWAESKKIKNIDYIKADAMRLPFKEGVFEFAVSSEVFEHLENPLEGMHELNRVLKKSGFGIISMPNLFSLNFLKSRIINKIIRLYRNIDVDPHYKFSYLKIKSMLSKAELTFIQNNSVDFFPMIEIILRKINNNLIINLIIDIDMRFSKTTLPFGAFYFVLVKKK